MTQSDPDASASDLIGTDIGPYRLVRRLGMGGMAETFVAVRRGPGGFSQRVCLKLVLPFHRGDQEFLELFRREARLAAKLRHSNIVGILDFGEVEGRSYMALELVDGVDLKVLLESRDGRRLPHEHVALIGYDIASALHHAHNPPHDSDIDGAPPLPIIHRDVSPSNVLVSRHGEVMLGDFGVAKAASASSGTLSTIKGKIPYMSPEQLKLESLDGRADLFAVGVVLFEALCGKRPYEGGHDPATIMRILEGQHPPLASLAPNAPTELCDLIERLIDPDRGKRPANAAELIGLLEPFVPPPRVRRELAEAIDELRPHDPALGSGTPASGEDPTEPSGDAGPAGPYTSGIVSTSASDSMPTDSASLDLPARRPGPLTWTGAILIAFVIAAAFWWSDGRPSPVEPVAEQADRGSAVARSREVAPVVEASREASLQSATAGPVRGLTVETEKTPPPPKPEKPSVRPAPPPTVRSAKLTVVVFPWGDVWINGQRRGSSPVRNLSLKPGRYRIAAGQGKPMVSEVVRLKPGENRTLELDVTKQ